MAFGKRDAYLRVSCWPIQFAPYLFRPHRQSWRQISMKGFALVFALLTCLVLNLAATQQPKKLDETSIRATVTDYIEGYYSGDAARMEKSLHPHYLKHTISGSDGQLKMTEKTGLQMVQD